MEDIITYSLKAGKETDYYQAIGIFTNEVIQKLNSEAGHIVSDFKTFIVKNQVEHPRSKVEYSLELLVLGILWRVYLAKALTLNEVPKFLMTSLTAFREKSKLFRGIVNYFKGFLGELWLLKESKADNVKFDTSNFKKLLEWLAATGEFKQEVNRLQSWYSYLGMKSAAASSATIGFAVNLAKWFEKRSNREIGYFTERVNDFLINDYNQYKYQEDNIFCGRSRVEYHMNMVGAEILNRAFREDFISTEEKRVLLPVCLRFQSEANCQATSSQNGQQCTGCTTQCKVNDLSQMGEKHGFQVQIIAHQSTAFQKDKIEPNKVGIVGIACVLNLLAGGWQAKDLGLVPQCVLLDYCGCKSHWHDSGLVTDINYVQLKNILQIAE